MIAFICQTAAVFAVITALLVPSAFAGAVDCTGSVLAAERAHDLPHGLLLAVALVESGRNGMPHAYALNLGSGSTYPDSRSAAAAELNGVDSAMVGCLQLSLEHHGEQFDSIEAMLDPRRNADYAAAYLKAAYEAHGTWGKALERYNGGNPARSTAYRCRVRAYLTVLAPETADLIGAPCPDTDRPEVAARVRTAVNPPIPSIKP